MKFFTPSLLLASLVLVHWIEASAVPFFASSETSDQYELRINQSLQKPVSINEAVELNENRRHKKHKHKPSVAPGDAAAVEVFGEPAPAQAPKPAPAPAPQPKAAAEPEDAE